MPMQIGLDEIISMLLSRVDGMAVNQENLKSKFNILSRVMYKKGLITDEDVVNSIREEHRLLKELGAISEMPDEDVVAAISDSILQWIKGDVEAIKESMKEYEKKMKEAMAKEKQKPKIDVASADMLNQLDSLSGGKSKSSKLII